MTKGTRRATPPVSPWCGSHPARKLLPYLKTEPLTSASECPGINLHV